MIFPVRMNKVLILILLATVVSSCSSKEAMKATQKNKGDLIVHVADGDASLPLNEASVTIEELSLTLETDKTGTAKFTALDPGIYSVTISHPYLKTIEEKDIKIEAGVIAERAIELISNERLGD